MCQREEEPWECSNDLETAKWKDRLNQLLAKVINERNKALSTKCFTTFQFWKRKRRIKQGKEITSHFTHSHSCRRDFTLNSWFFWGSLNTTLVQSKWPWFDAFLWISLFYSYYGVSTLPGQSNVPSKASSSVEVTTWWITGQKYESTLLYESVLVFCFNFNFFEGIFWFI